MVAHEHHSFPDLSGPDLQNEDERQVHAVHDHWFECTAAKDLEGLMRYVADDIVSSEHDAPLQYVGRGPVREFCRNGLASAEGAVSWDVPDMRMLIPDDLAVVWGLNRMTAQEANGTTSTSWSRGTRVLQRRDGEWSMVHQHVSCPRDAGTGQARTDLSP